MSKIDSLFSLEGKVALVTGAGSGMGARFADTLADAGATVICAGRRKDQIEKVAANIIKSGGKAVAIQLDIGDVANVEAAFDRAEETVGRVNVLVNAAGQLDFEMFPDITDDCWSNLINVIVSGTMYMCRSFSKRLIQNDESGVIVNITSIVGMRVMPAMSVYAAAKAALNQLTRGMARDMFEKNIRCNAIAPGFFETAMSAGFLSTDEGKTALDLLPLKRLGTVDELDGALLLLVSSAGSYINGVVLPVDSGQMIQLH